VSLCRGMSTRLREVSESSNDDPDLHLCTQENWCADGQIDYPYSLTLHAVVATSDGCILTARRSTHSVHPRDDHEFTEGPSCDGLSLGRNCSSRRGYHPTAGLRMLLASGSGFGFYRFGSQLGKAILRGR